MKQAFSWVAMASFILMFSFQNCSSGHMGVIETDDGFTPKVSEMGSSQVDTGTSAIQPAIENPTSAATLPEMPVPPQSEGASSNASSASSAPTSTASSGGRKAGLNIGVFMSQKIVDSIGNVGSWYYNYSPHPNRANSVTTYNTVNWANTYGKEFVPMIIGRTFKYGPADGGCPLIEEFAAKNTAGQITEAVCDVNLIGNTLLEMKKLFKTSNQPKYLLTFNEPYIVKNNQYAMDPGQAAKAFGKIQKAAKMAGLSVVSPTLSSDVLGSDQPGLNWMTEFLVACYDRRTDPNFPCDINGISSFQIHDYQCTENFWKNNYANGAYRQTLVKRLNGARGVDWKSYFSKRPGWVTETNCNWDPDFLADHMAGQYKRTQRESCLRATGQKSGFGKGSLWAITSMPDNAIFRFAWWNTYADPNSNSDQASVTASSINRITAARLMDDSGKFTATGRSVKQTMADPSKLATVDCEDPVTVGLFMLPNGSVYVGFKDFYCKYQSTAAVKNVYGANWAAWTKSISRVPSGMTDAGVCGPNQGIYRQTGAIYYTYKQGYTCWINSMAKLANFTGIVNTAVLPETNMSARGLDAKAIASRICQ